MRLNGTSLPGLRWVEGCATCLLGAAFIACLMGLALLASCSPPDDGGQAQSFNAHINGSYTFAAGSASVR
jgi:hypothetical protein